MATHDEVTWFAKSRRHRVHFKNQHTLIVREKLISSQSGAYVRQNGSIVALKGGRDSRLTQSVDSRQR
jgi:hypothetical protein